MAPTISYTAIPASLWTSDSWFVQRSERAQLLYLKLWTSDARDSAGFVPFQPNLWSKCSTPPSKTIGAAVEELVASAELLVDEHMEKAWLRRFLGEDAHNSPNQYVSALNHIRTCQSGMLRDAAWDEVQRLGLPPVKTENPKKPGDMEGRMKKAYDALRVQMYAKTDAPPEGLRYPLDAPSKPPNVNANASKGAGAGVNPGEAGLLCSLGCDRVAGPDGRCDECVSAGRL